MRPFLLLVLTLLTAAAARADNPYGLMLWPKDDRDLGTAAARAAALGVAWYRPPTLFIDRWRATSDCTPCRDLSKVGLKLAITVRNGGRESLPRRPSTPPADLAAFEAGIATILALWRPDLLVVEDEENEPLRYADGQAPGVWDSGSGTARLYRRELDSACRQAHANHLSCSNGGLSYAAAAGLTWLTLLNEGKSTQACDYARRSFGDPEMGIDATSLCRIQEIGKVPAVLRGRLLRNADQLLPVYRDSAIDAVNFHWYGTDAVALTLTIDVLQRLVGKPAITNEIGQRKDFADPGHVRPLLRAAFAGHMQLVVWYSVDGVDSLSLFDRDGSLRPSGEQFQHQMSGLK
jgi:hypothetical protein